MKSVKPRWTTDDIKNAITRANKVLRGSATTPTDHNVALRAAAYTNASWSVIENYIKALTPVQRADLGFPDPNPEREEITKLRPGSASTARYRGTW